MDVRREVSLCSAEGVRHTGADWTNPDNRRFAILIAYNHVMVHFHETQAMYESGIDRRSA